MKRLRLRRFSRKPADNPAPVAKAVEPAAPPQQVGSKNRHAPKVEQPMPVPRASRDPKVGGLNAKQGLFLRHYLECGNATEAAKRAGYAKGSAGQMGHELLKNPKIAAEIRKRQIAVIEKLDVTAERVQAELAKAGFFNIIDCMRFGDDGEVNFDLSGLTREQGAALGEVTIEEFTDGRSDKRQVRRIKVKPADKLQALTMLGRHLGMFTEKHEHDHRHTLVGALMDEIDQASRGNNAKLIEHQPTGGEDGKAA